MQRLVTFIILSIYDLGKLPGSFRLLIHFVEWAQFSFLKYTTSNHQTARRKHATYLRVVVHIFAFGTKTDELDLILADLNPLFSAHFSGSATAKVNLRRWLFLAQENEICKNKIY